ncbi:uncharacterized protein Z519_03316 [Cladophialophora bantiana CBS 173.52]|uniref:Peptidase S9 prolyl oligopeptidase catalytic domain-containing protein n=1 Tax=Cladophialophora bantiana (strain ATCC 10958 / CBS 173.52 / CDC B-1940 / NIH 8579) TaxID=1442370 RepID=A0A0D2HRZ1_CLAB1|nr:uncharacterized protein Z519_03316 [Cladophialophora bantiana CBS 173.52]KIW96248.1 hypothetical protein Z519_03316 [Cladophialophora bantiana CBS 173.52]
MLSGGEILVVRSINVRDQIQIFSRTGQHLKTGDDDIRTAALLHLRGAEYGTNTRTIIPMGETMGGLNCATAMVQQPDIFDAVVLNAGAVDTLHRQRLGRSDRGGRDIGDVHDPVDFDFISKWSPLDKARSGDDFVSYSHGCKTAAALQCARAAAGGDLTHDQGLTEATTYLRIIRD